MTKEEQRAEAEARRSAIKGDDGEVLPADQQQQPIDDNTGARFDEPGERRQQQDDGEPEPRERRKISYMSPSDEARANIAKKFDRRTMGGDDGEEGDVPFNGNLNDQEMLYGRAGRDEPEPVVNADGEPEPEPAPARKPAAEEKRYTIRVRGKDMHLTEAEVLERAAKVEAADQYLEEGRNLLEQSRDIRRANAERDGTDPRRPGERNNTQDEPTDLATDDGQHPDPLEQVIEEIQFGDPKEGAKKLRSAITQTADQSADARQVNRLVQKDNIASSKAIQTFLEKNPELQDADTERWMEHKLYDLQRAEIVALGTVPAEKIPADNKAMAKWHQLYRVHGAEVSSQEKLLEVAKDRLDKFRGVSKPAQQQERRREAPRVEVNVDRNTRRAAIPSQPTRASAPRPDAAQPQPQASSRSTVIANMRKSRGQLVG